ncbi:MAG: ABC transporter substrate-binding protein, partial [Desulfobacterales bacterium]|nr:ABC transporter substrate-binding protein [Desulfobacterales bacterium]
IVMWHAGEPVTAGLANSLARPGKNVTGISTYADAGVWAKLVELLHDANPKIKRIGVLWDYVPPFNTRKLAESYLQEIRKAARAYAITLHIAEVSRSDQVPAALAQIETSRPDALLSTAGPGIGVGSRAQRIPQFAVDKRLPLAVDVRWNPLLDPYPMLVYAPSHRELMGIAVSYVDRILKGAKPAALPFQQPLKLELLVNLKTAKAIGLSVSQALLLRADVVVE